MIYYIFLINLVIFSFCELFGFNKLKHEYKKSNCYMFIMLLLYMTLLSALRFHTGSGDYIQYEKYFECCLTDTKSTFEFGFVLLNKCFKVLFNNFYIMQLFISFFCCISIGKFIYKNTDFPITTLLIYFINYHYLYDMSQTRQWIAMVILIDGFGFIKSKKIIPYLFIVALAMQFHITAIFGIFLFFIQYIKNRKTLYVFVVLGLYLSFFGKNFISVILNLLLKFSFLPNRINLLINAYFISKLYSSQVKFNSGIGFLANLFLLIYIIKKYDNGTNETKQYFVTANAVSFLFTGFAINVEILTRLIPYFYLVGGGMFSVSYIFHNKNVRLDKYLYCFLKLFLLMYYSYLLVKEFKGVSANLIPYSTFLYPIVYR